MKYRYELRETGSPSFNIFPCDVCGKSCSKTFIQIEEREFEPGKYTHSGCRTVFGHENCLKSIQQ